MLLLNIPVKSILIIVIFAQDIKENNLVMLCGLIYCMSSTNAATVWLHLELFWFLLF